MKRIVVILAAVATAGLAWAKGVEQVSVVENEITTISVPFAITSYLPSNKEVVRIEELSGTSLRITALKRGRCDLEVRGDKALSQKYEITVLGDLATTLDTLTSELDQVQEVRARIVGDFIRVDGEVSAIQKWEYLQKVLRNYKGVVHNFALFSPGPDVLLRLKGTMQEAGFKVVFQSLGRDRKAWPANTISLVLNKQTQIMSVQGRVYTPEQKAKVAECLATERWLSTELKPATDAAGADAEFRIRAQLDVFVDRPQIRISLAYMAIDDEDVKKIGNMNASGAGAETFMGLDGTFRILYDLVHGNGHSTRSAAVGASLNTFTRFLKQNNISRVSETGYTVMESWDKDGAKFKSGGTMYVSATSTTGGGNGVAVSTTSEIKEIPYGFQLNTVGGVVPEGDSVDMMVDFTLSSVTFDGPRQEPNRLEESTKQKLVLPLGKTTFLGGRKMIHDDRMSPSGLPILRSTPMLNWFVADSGTSISDRRLVIMVCPEIVDNTTEKIDTAKEIDIPVKTEGVKPTEQREEERRPFPGGLWNPLNWFVF